MSRTSQGGPLQFYGHRWRRGRMSRTSQGVPCLNNIDVWITRLVKPVPLVDFLLMYQNVRDPYDIDWGRAKCTLKNLRIKSSSTNIEYKIVGLSKQPCNQQRFQLTHRNNGDGNGGCESNEITVSEYLYHMNVDLDYSGDFPCIIVGKRKRPTYLPIELCILVPQQRYTRALTTIQKPQEGMSILSEGSEIGFSLDDLQELVHSLSYVYQRSTTAMSVGWCCIDMLRAPCGNSDGKFMKFDDLSETSSGHGVTSADSIMVSEMPRLNEMVSR